MGDRWPFLIALLSLVAWAAVGIMARSVARERRWLVVPVCMAIGALAAIAAGRCAVDNGPQMSEVSRKSVERFVELATEDYRRGAVN